MNEKMQQPTESSEADDLFDNLHRVLEMELSFSSHFPTPGDNTESSPTYVVEYLSGGTTSAPKQQDDEICGESPTSGEIYHKHQQSFPLLYQGTNFGTRVANVHKHSSGGRPLPPALHSLNKVYPQMQDYQQRPRENDLFDPARDGMGYAPHTNTISQVASAALAAAASGNLTEMKRRKGAYNMSHLVMDPRGFLPFERLRDYVGKAHAVVVNNLEPKTNSNNLLSIFFPLGATDALAVGCPVGNEDAVRLFGTRRGGVALFSSADMANMAAEKIDDFVPSGQSQPLRAFFFGSFADYDNGNCVVRIRDAFYMPIHTLAMGFMEPHSLQPVLLTAVANCEDEAKDAGSVVAERLAYHPGKYLRMVTTCIYIISRGGTKSHSISSACANAFFTTLSSFVIQKGVMSKTASRSLRLACGIVCAHLFDTEVLAGGHPYLMSLRLGGSVVTEIEKQTIVRDSDPGNLQVALLSPSAVLLETVVAMIMTWESLQIKKNANGITGDEQRKKTISEHRRQYLAMIKKVIDAGCAPKILLSIYGHSDAILSKDNASDKKSASEDNVDLTIRRLSLSTTSSLSGSPFDEENQQDENHLKLLNNPQLENTDAEPEEENTHNTYDWEYEVRNSMTTENCIRGVSEVSQGKDENINTNGNIPLSGRGFVVTSSDKSTTVSVGSSHHNHNDMSIDSTLSVVSSIGPTTRNTASGSTHVNRLHNSFTVNSGSHLVTPEKVWPYWATDTLRNVSSSNTPIRDTVIRSNNTSISGSQHNGSPASHTTTTYMKGPHSINNISVGQYQCNTANTASGPCMSASINQLSSYVLMCTVYMTKVPVYLDASTMRKVFFHFGDINKVRIYEDREANGSSNNSNCTIPTHSETGGFSTRGSFGFVEFATPQSARAMVDFFRNPTKSVSSMFLIPEEELAAVLTMRVSFARSSIHDQDPEDAIYAQTVNHLTSTPDVVKMKGCSFGL